MSSVRADACSSQSPSSVSAQAHFVWALSEQLLTLPRSIKLLLGSQAEGADVTGGSAEHAMVLYLPSGT